MEKLTILVDKEAGIVSFEGYEGYSRIEIMGILDAAKATVDVLYKTNVMATIEQIEKIKNEEKNG